MTRTNRNPSRLGRAALSSLLLVSMLALAAPLTTASAQTPVVTATPGSVNFGLTTSITVTAPAAGTYSVVVIAPNGQSSSVPFVPTTAGQTQTTVFGNATSGFDAVVNQVGTYNVYLEQGTTVVGSSSFYATNKLFITMDMVTGGTCYFINNEPRGWKWIPRFYVYYASNPTLPLTTIAVNATLASTLIHDTNLTVTFTQPDNKTVTKAAWDTGAKLWRGVLNPTWNYTYVGTWDPTVTANDPAGNTGTYTFSSVASFGITPATFTTTIQLIDTKTGAPVASIYPGESITISATVMYPTNPEPVSGFVTGLDSVKRGGVVNAMVGYGAYNVTAGTFGTKASPGGVLGTVALTNTNGVNGTWSAQFTVPSTLPTLAKGATFGVAITSKDSASPPNTGLQVMGVGLAPTPAAGTVTTTTVTAAPVTTTTTATASGAVSTAMSTITSTISQITQQIPTIAYAGMIILLALGLIVGLLLRMPRSK